MSLSIWSRFWSIYNKLRMLILYYMVKLRTKNSSRSAHNKLFKCSLDWVLKKKFFDQKTLSQQMNTTIETISTLHSPKFSLLCYLDLIVVDSSCLNLFLWKNQKIKIIFWTSTFTVINFYPWTISTFHRSVNHYMYFNA